MRMAIENEGTHCEPRGMSPSSTPPKHPCLRRTRPEHMLSSTRSISSSNRTPLAGTVDSRLWKGSSKAEVAKIFGWQKRQAACASEATVRGGQWRTMDLHKSLPVTLLNCSHVYRNIEHLVSYSQSYECSVDKNAVQAALQPSHQKLKPLLQHKLDQAFSDLLRFHGMLMRLSQAMVALGGSSFGSLL